MPEHNSNNWQYAKLNASTQAKIDVSQPLGKGSFKEVYQGVYVSGPSAGERCVAKLMLQNDDAGMEEDFGIELEVVAEARRLVRLFNEGGFLDRQVFVAQPEVWRFEDACEARWRGRLCLVEPLIVGYTRFNSNTGFNRVDGGLDWPLAMQALSHFSYHKTGGSKVLCDLQGGSMGDDVVLTDPIVMTRTKELGNQDLGKRGLELFFTHHTCNKYCHKEWHRPRNRVYGVDIKEGSSYTDSAGMLMHDAFTRSGDGAVFMGLPPQPHAPALPTIKEEQGTGSPAPPGPTAATPPAQPRFRPQHHGSGRPYVPRRFWRPKTPKTPVSPLPGAAGVASAAVGSKRSAADAAVDATISKRMKLQPRRQQVNAGLSTTLNPTPMMSPAANMQVVSKR